MKAIRTICAIGLTISLGSAFGGINAEPTITKTIVVLTFKRTDGTPASINGVHFDKTFADCTAVNTDATSTTGPVDGATKKSLDENPWSITCIRKSQAIGSDVIYPAFDLVIGSTAGPFSYPIPAEARVAYQFASDIKKQIETVDSRVSSIRLTSVSAKYPGAPGPCPAGTRDSGLLVYNTYPGGPHGQGTSTRVCIVG